MKIERCVCGNPQTVNKMLENSIICCASCGLSHADLIEIRKFVDEN